MSATKELLSDEEYYSSNYGLTPGDYEGFKRDMAEQQKALDLYKNMDKIVEIIGRLEKDITLVKSLLGGNTHE